MKKKGFSLSDPKALIVGIIVAVISISLIAGTISTLINDTIAIGTIPNMPLSSLFAAGGAVVLLIGAAVIFAFVKLFLGGKK